MKEVEVSLPEIAMVAGTRAILGVGVGLLLADRLPESQRKAVGWTLFLIGAVATIPLVLEVFGKAREIPPSVDREPGRNRSRMQTSS